MRDILTAGLTALGLDTAAAPQLERYAALLLGKGIGAAASVPGNLVQGAVGLVAGFLLLQVAHRTHLEEKIAV